MDPKAYIYEAAEPVQVIDTYPTSVQRFYKIVGTVAILCIAYTGVSLTAKTARAIKS